MRTVHEVSALTGVSIRTLHHYDAIDLLKPSKVTDAGYRLYNDAALSRLQIILMFRELQFPLKEIKAILDSPEFDINEALSQQITLLKLQQKHIEGLISLARSIQEKGVNEMGFHAFEKTELEQFAEEVKKRWGTTQAYQEYEQKNAGKTDSEQTAAAKQIMQVFTEFGTMRSLPPSDSVVQEKVAALQSFITENYYHCTNDILNGLAQMYTEDKRFKDNIDNAGGDGTAAFVQQAIQIYCGA